MLLSALGCATLPVKAAQAASIFTDPSLFINPTVIDFEPEGSGNTVLDINQFLSSTGATLSIGTGGGARIDDLSDNERAINWRVGLGADGGPVSGIWGFEGGVRAESSLSLTFAPDNLADSVGVYWGGATVSRARAVVTLEDSSTFTAFVRDFLPTVPNNAPESEAINGFLGINGDGKLIREVTFFNNNDLFSFDDPHFSRPNRQSVPEPSTLGGLGAFVVLGALLRRKKRR